MAKGYSEVIDYLFHALPVFQHTGGSAYKPGLQTITELCEFYGRPFARYPTIHVAGTNGKGSVAHMLTAALQGCGYKTGLFTSPHLIDFRERIRIDGQMIAEEDVIRFVHSGRQIFDRVQPSFFEITAAMAFDHFARNKVDVAVIETGMGGRLDATNIIAPLLSVITNISFDHTQFLGKTLEAIAIEKAGIMKPTTPVVIGETQAAIAHVFTDKAQLLACDIRFADRQAEVLQSLNTLQGQTFLIREGAREFSLTVDLAGEYQRNNILTVLAAIRSLQEHTTLSLPDGDVFQSLEHAASATGLMGRWQILRRHPLTVCDAGHNTGGLQWVVHQLSQYSCSVLRIVVGFVSDKDISAMLAMLPATATYYFTRASIPRALDETALMQQAQAYSLHGKAYPTVHSALSAAWRDAADDDLIFVGGSIFVVAEALEMEDCGQL